MLRRAATALCSAGAAAAGRARAAPLSPSLAQAAAPAVAAAERARLLSASAAAGAARGRGGGDGRDVSSGRRGGRRGGRRSGAWAGAEAVEAEAADRDAGAADRDAGADADADVDVDAEDAEWMDALGGRFGTGDASRRSASRDAPTAHLRKLSSRLAGVLLDAVRAHPELADALGPAGAALEVHSARLTRDGRKAYVHWSVAVGYEGKARRLLRAARPYLKAFVQDALDRCVWVWVPTLECAGASLKSAHAGCAQGPRNTARS